jgi:hypothetical protein
MRTSSTITRWQRRNMGRGPVVVGRRPCEPHYPTLLSLGRGSHLKRESHPSPIRLVFWGDWAFPRGAPLSCGSAIALALQACSSQSDHEGRNLGCANAKLSNQCIRLTIIQSLPGPDSSGVGMNPLQHSVLQREHVFDHSPES